MRPIIPATPEQALPLFRRVFGEVPDASRLHKALIYAVFDGDQSPIAAVAVETGAFWHIWLLAVETGRRSHGLGGRVVEFILNLAAEQRVVEVRIKTFQHWQGMQGILRKGNWYLCGAELANRYDGVREIWQHVRLPDPARLLVIGANPKGRGGEWLERARAMPLLFSVQGIVDPSEQVRDFWQEQGLETFNKAEDLKDAERFDAAVIAVPPMQVTKVQLHCIGMGIPYLVEKPIAGSLAELLHLQSRLQEARMGIAIGVQRRAHPTYVALKSALLNAEIKSLFIRITLGRPVDDIPAGHRADSAQCRGGALLDLGYHALDLAHFLLGRPLELITCSLSAGTDLAADLESSARILARCGVTWVRLEVDRHGSGKDESVQVLTADGVWTANRERVRSPDDSTLYQCPGSWEKAELGTLTSLAALSGRNRAGSVDLWEHLSLFETIEKAYSSARILGIEGFKL